jgi:IS5 family transposase
VKIGDSGLSINDVDIAVDIVKETKALFPRFSCCSFDKGFHSPDNQRQLAEVLEHCTMPKKGKRMQLQQAA